MIALLLAGCFVRYEPIRNAARAERTGSPDAEETWRDVLDDDLLVGEWRMARRRMCALALERIRRELDGLDVEVVAPEAVGRLREDLDGCPGVGSTIAELTMLEQAAALRELEAIGRSDRSVYDRLVAAEPLAPHVLADHPFRRTLEDWRGEWEATLQDRLTRFPTPATRAWIGELSPGGAGPTLAETANELLADRVSEVTSTTDADCDGLAPTPWTEGGAATVTGRLDVRDCKVSRSQGQVDVHYTVTAYRDELQKVPVRTTVRTATTVHNVNCYYSIQQSRQVCTHVGTYTDYDTETTTTYVDKMVPVPYEVPKVRQETRYTTTVSATVVPTVQTPHGTRTLPAQTRTHRATGTSQPSAGRAFAELFEGRRAALVDDLSAAARALHLDALRAGASTADPAGLERRLLLLAAGSPLSPTEREAMAGLLDLPAGAVGPDRHPIADLSPAPLQYRPLAYQLPHVDSEALRWGFPLMMYSVGFGHLDGGDFTAHRTPRSAFLKLHLEANVPMSTGRSANGLALHLMPLVDTGVGRRLNKRHAFTELRLGQMENEKEPGLSVDLRASAAAMVGFRSTGFGVFAGIQPAAHFSTVGYYANAGQHVHLAGRLEIRPVPRRPLIVNGWFGDLLDPTNADLGVRVNLPIGERLWMSAEHSTVAGDTRLRGLHDEDRLDGGLRQLRRTWVGWSVGF